MSYFLQSCPKCGSQMLTHTFEFETESRTWDCQACGEHGEYQEKQPMFYGTVWTPRPTACDACTGPDSCRRIGECLRYKCEFGKVDKP